MTVGWKTGLIKRKMLQYLKVVATMLLSHGNTDTLLASMVVARAELPLGKDMSPTEEGEKRNGTKSPNTLLSTNKLVSPIFQQQYRLSP